MSTAIIIGGSSGIGKAIINNLKDDYSTINMSRHNYDEFIDVTNYNVVKNTFDNIFTYNIDADILIYCAGFVKPQGIFELTPEMWNQTINTNLNGAYYCTQQFIKRNIGSNKKIIYIASTAGTRPQVGWSAYAASKAALINFALTMHEELKAFNVQVYCIAPGRCATPLRQILAPTEDQTQIMQPNEVADFVRYILDDKSNVLCGQVITVKKI